MDLIVWRHAEAIDLDLVGDDMLRTLTPRGERQAARMAEWLDRFLPDGTRVWSSPAARAEQTVMALDRKFKLSPMLAPLSNTDQLLELVQWPHAKGSVLVVGHQPTLGATIARLLGTPEQAISVKKGAVWWLRYRERENQGQTVVLSVQTPELI
jgi:phosphohistidine phosphatase